MQRDDHFALAEKFDPESVKGGLHRGMMIVFRQKLAQDVTCPPKLEG